MSNYRVTRFKEGEFKGCLDLTHIRFGKLIAEKVLFKDKQGAVWFCICDCGLTSEVHGKRLNAKLVNSCGCGEGAKTHGMSYTKEYKAWRAMKSRCLVPTTEGYSEYGGRGIGISSEWEDSFEKFFADMGTCPTGMSLDRIDVNGNYYKENCRWANQSMQVFNTRLRDVNTSGKTGVSFHEKSSKWRARITVDLTEKYLGIYDSFEDAVKIREEAELKYFGFIKE